MPRRDDKMSLTFSEDIDYSNDNGCFQRYLKQTVCPPASGKIGSICQGARQKVADERCRYPNESENRCIMPSIVKNSIIQTKEGIYGTQ